MRNHFRTFQGRSGSGKTALLNCIRLEYSPDRGKVLTDLSRDIAGFLGGIYVCSLPDRNRSRVMAAEEVITPDMIREVFGMRARVEYDEEMGGISVTLIGRHRQSRRTDASIFPFITESQELLTIFFRV